MPIENRPGNPDNAPKDPMQKALERAEELVGSPQYNKDALQRALTRVRQTGARINVSPGELYTTLANLKGRLGESAAQHDKPDDAAEFTKQQDLLNKTSEQFALGKTPTKEKPKTSKKSKTSKLRQTTGKAAG